MTWPSLPSMGTSLCHQSSCLVKAVFLLFIYYVYFIYFQRELETDERNGGYLSRNRSFKEEILTGDVGRLPPPAPQIPFLDKTSSSASLLPPLLQTVFQLFTVQMQGISCGLYLFPPYPPSLVHFNTGSPGPLK